MFHEVAVRQGHTLTEKGHRLCLFPESVVENVVLQPLVLNVLLSEKRLVNATVVF
jgi:hypothetical protein